MTWAGTPPSRNWSKDQRTLIGRYARPPHVSDHAMLRDVVPGPITLLRTALANLTAEECGQEDRLRGLTAMGGGPLLDSKAHRARADTTASAAFRAVVPLSDPGPLPPDEGDARIDEGDATSDAEVGS